MKLDSSEGMLVAELFKNSKKKNLSLGDTVVDIEKLVGDASTRRYYRVQTDEESYVVCLSDPILNSEQNENFIRIQNCFKDNSISVPEIYDVVLEKGYMLQKDLGDNTMLKALGQTRGVDEEYSILETAIEEMVKIHSVNKEESEKASNGLMFDLEKLMSEVCFCTENFIANYLKAKLSDVEQRVIESSFIKICERLSSEKMVLTHRDFHTRNVMIAGNKQFLIDFQDARLGIPQYDLASMLEDNYYSFDSRNVDKIKNTYWENFVKPRELQNSFEQFDSLYYLMQIQRTYKALGTFGSIYCKRSDERYLKYIGFSFEKLRSTLQHFEEFYDLKQVLSHYYYAS